MKTAAYLFILATFIASVTSRFGLRGKLTEVVQAAVNLFVLEESPFIVNNY